MALVCALTGEVPEHPVLSPLSGAVFEKRNIEKYIAQHGTDPVTGGELAVDQLIAVQVPKTVRPRVPEATSIPALLKLFQDEWDACMLENYSLRQDIEAARQELSHALYQHDAACRVIARLTRERDQARQALAALGPSLQGSQSQPMQVQGGDGDQAGVAAQVNGIPADIAEQITKHSKALSKERKQRQKDSDLATPEALQAFAKKNEWTSLHASNHPGITCVDVVPSRPSLIVTGGMDKNVVVFDRSEERILSTLKGHSKKVTRVALHPTEDVVVSSSADATVRIWGLQGNLTHTLHGHADVVSGVSLHPLGAYVLSVSEDKSWAFSDLRAGALLYHAPNAVTSKFTAVKVHPDGAIFGTGCDNSIVHVWDVKQGQSIAAFEGHMGPITDLAFSENGFYLATASLDSTVKIWDLRKIKNIHTISLGKDNAVSSLDFDYSGSYLAVGGSDTRVYSTKAWDLLSTFTENKDLVSGVKFGHNAKYLVTSSLDRSLTLFA